MPKTHTLTHIHEVTFWEDKYIEVSKGMRQRQIKNTWKLNILKYENWFFIVFTFFLLALPDTFYQLLNCWFCDGCRLLHVFYQWLFYMVDFKTVYYRRSLSLAHEFLSFLFFFACYRPVVLSIDPLNQQFCLFIHSTKITLYSTSSFRFLFSCGHKSMEVIHVNTRVALWVVVGCFILYTSSLYETTFLLICFLFPLHNLLAQFLKRIPLKCFYFVALDNGDNDDGVKELHFWPFLIESNFTAHGTFILIITNEATDTIHPKTGEILSNQDIH